MAVSLEGPGCVSPPDDLLQRLATRAMTFALENNVKLDYWEFDDGVEKFGSKKTRGYGHLTLTFCLPPADVERMRNTLFSEGGA